MHFYKGTHLSLNYQSRTIADARILQLSGIAGVGVYQIRFSVELHRPAWPGLEGQGVRLTDMCARVSIGTKVGAVALLGTAYPERPIVLTPSQYSDKACVLFDLDLSPQQMFELEKLRGGGDLYFQMEMMGLASGPRDNFPVHDTIAKLVTLSDWRNVLGDMDYADILVLGFEIPNGKEGTLAADAARCLRQAQENLLRGRYDTVVAQCRLAIEGVHVATGDASAASASAARYANGKERKLMTKSERSLFIGEAVRHFAHLAHHLHSDGTQETFSRADAQAILACTVAFVDCALNRVRNETDQVTNVSRIIS